MVPFSIVIVTKDAADIIGRLLQSLKGLSDDVIVCDTGSSDNTIAVARGEGAIVHEIPWEGYGKSKNVATGFAKYDWVLSFDSDEKIDPVLYQALKEWQPVSDQTIHQVLWKNFFGDQWIRYSDWGNSWKNRLFNRKTVNWDHAIAHEDLQSDKPLQYRQFPGYLEHYSFKDMRQYNSKMVHSALITAEKYHMNGKKVGLLKIFFAPFFSFVKTYIVKKGFLDGYKGWVIAKVTAHYTFVKYTRLYELNQRS